MIRKLVPIIVEKLVKYLAGPDCGEDDVGHMLDEDVGGGVAELACGERVDGDAFRSGRKKMQTGGYLLRKMLKLSLIHI